MEPEKGTTRHPNPIGSPVEETATEARQGRKGTPVLKVLVAALILAALAWGGAEWWGEIHRPASRTDRNAACRRGCTRQFRSRTKRNTGQ
ncbi:hypothetical protein N7E02_16525 [Aliirhizobium terrae]|uniref:hypothetical protein n=1 Tax=Terrirhizobium terrae TaxID=2926709 RepID=UPI002578EA62|nr:hypothetical protein [Rhizobium sp. CC-CFT758]WJH41846.1 hypothetical protein N7E02_16525 [Rhizobium sp. CC-CFT758]